jgi:hypothetical protein
MSLSEYCIVGRRLTDCAAGVALIYMIIDELWRVKHVTDPSMSISFKKMLAAWSP